MIVDDLKSKIKGMEVIKAYPPSGQKQVYLVNTDDYNTVILKIIKNMDERIEREIDVVNSNNITGAPKILLFDNIDINAEKYYYLIEEFIDGETLKSVLSKGALPVKESLILLEELLQVVVELEKINVVHRDIKPENIICGTDKKYHLIDFGIARNLNLSSLTFTQMAVGPHTPGYGAPELFQYNKATISSKADLFSVGVVVYESLFGKHPFVTGNEIDINEIWYRTATVAAKNYIIEGDTDNQLIGFIQTLMQKQVSKRPPSAKKAMEWYHAVLDTLTL